MFAINSFSFHLCFSKTIIRNRNVLLEKCMPFANTTANMCSISTNAYPNGFLQTTAKRWKTYANAHYLLILLRNLQIYAHFFKPYVPFLKIFTRFCKKCKTLNGIFAFHYFSFDLWFAKTIMRNRNVLFKKAMAFLNATTNIC